MNLFLQIISKFILYTYKIVETSAVFIRPLTLTSSNLKNLSKLNYATAFFLAGNQVQKRMFKFKLSLKRYRINFIQNTQHFRFTLTSV